MPITEKQKEMRLKHIGASESAAILGMNPWATAYDVWMEKTGRIMGFDGNEACDLGNMIEDGLLDWAGGEVGDRIIKNQYRVHAGGVLSATHDALSMENSNIGYEAKTAGLLNPWNANDVWGEARTDEIPDHYIIQCQHQMLVSDLDIVFVPALIGGRGRVMFEVKRNYEIGEAILEACECFWEKNVKLDMPPTDCPKLETVKRMRREPGKVVLVNADVVQDWLSAKAAEELAKKDREQAEAAMLALVGDAEAADCRLGRLVIKTVESTRFDRKALKAVYPEIEKQFLSVSAYQRMNWKAAS